MNLARLLCLSLLVLAAGSLQLATSHAEGGTLSISGTIWQDTNADGIQQPEEYGLSNQTIELGTTYNGQYFYTNAAGRPLYLDSQGHTFRTDATGAYKIEGLNPGPYSVRLMSGTGSNTFFQTYPTRRGSGEYSTAVTLDSQPVTGINFGLVQPTNVRTYRGLAWLDATSVPRPVVHTFIDGIDCTVGGSLLPTDLPRNAFVVGLAPASLIPGCGAPGKTVTFRINGRTAIETVEWTPPSTSPPLVDAIPMPGAAASPLPPPGDPASNQRWLDISAGVPFAYVTASPIGDTYLDADTISAEINGIECGRGFVEAWGTVYLVIASDQVTPGCGRDGIDFFVLQDGVTVAGPVPWHPGSLLAVPLPLTGKPRPTAPTSGPDSNQ